MVAPPVNINQLPNLPTPFKISETDNGFTRMQSEEDRQSTFGNWRVPFISKHSLAKDGFYYTGQNDIVRCAFCSVEIGCWEEGDVPNTEHKRWSPSCPFLKRRVQSQSQSSTSNANQSFDTCGPLEQRPNSIEPCTSLLSTLGVETQIGVSFPKYSLLEKRLESFKDWPVSMKQKPVDLANAGFYYTGLGDQTICFCCGIGLKDWQEHDGVWEEHALWSPKCTYLRLKKDLEVNSNVSDKNTAVLNGTNVEYDKACSSLNININVQKASSAAGTPEEEKPSPLNLEKAKTSQKEDDALLCGICYSNERSILYLPCRHMIACVDCGSNAKKCPVCRKEVRAFVKAYLS